MVYDGTMSLKKVLIFLKKQRNMNSPLVSIIITTKNEEVHLPRLLENIAKQTYKIIETIVVDNNSKDQTKAIAKNFGAEVFSKGPERSAQRNFGAQNAKGEYLLFLDADMELTPNVGKECVNKIQEPRTNNQELLAMVIPEQSFGIGFWTRCKILERMCYEGIDWIESARFFQKKVFFEVGGYDEELTGPEDFELPQRIKFKYGSESIGRIKSYILHDEGKISLAKLLAKKYYYGRKMRQYSAISESKAYFAKQANPLYRFALFFRRFDLLVKDPIHAVGMVLLKLLEMTALVLGDLRG